MRSMSRRLLASVAMAAAILLASGASGRQSACAAEDGTCDAVPQCPDFYPSNVGLWHQIPNVGTTQTKFILKQPHQLQNPPKFGTGTY